MCSKNRPRSDQDAGQKGGLQDYKALAYATHGLVARGTEGLAGLCEPALVLTSPETSSELDDGLLTASEGRRHQPTPPLDETAANCCNNKNARNTKEPVPCPSS
ncbi:MAG: hypothetical protein ACKVG6_17600, partial [Alphaproteobacteria bacterium]